MQRAPTSRKSGSNAPHRPIVFCRHGSLRGGVQDDLAEGVTRRLFMNGGIRVGHPRCGLVNYVGRRLRWAGRGMTNADGRKGNAGRKIVALPMVQKSKKKDRLAAVLRHAEFCRTIY
jgi:hypothetical protein